MGRQILFEYIPSPLTLRGLASKSCWMILSFSICKEFKHDRHFLLPSEDICCKTRVLQPIPSLFPDRNILGDINESLCCLKWVVRHSLMCPSLTVGGLPWCVCFVFTTRMHYAIAIWNVNSVAALNVIGNESCIGHFWNLQVADAVNIFGYFFRFPFFTQCRLNENNSNCLSVWAVVHVIVLSSSMPSFNSTFLSASQVISLLIPLLSHQHSFPTSSMKMCIKS